MKNLIRKWLGIDSLEKDLERERNYVLNLQDDLHDVIDHFNLQNILWPGRIAGRRIKSQTVTAQSIAAPKLIVD